MKIRDICIGGKYRLLTVIEIIHANGTGKTRVRVKCDCGKETIILANSLNKTSSCGCLVKKARQCAIQRALAVKRSNGHGHSKLRIYRIWAAMKARCYCKNSAAEYHRYGGRGIIVCEEWRNSFVAFEKWAIEHGYTDKMTIDRIDTNGMYCPENCKWSTMAEQQNNRSNNKKITFRGITLGESEWARKVNIPRGTLQYRLDIGWDIERALTTPVRFCGKRANAFGRVLNKI